MKKLNKKGFTLVELLAVIVVLALLMVVAASTIGNALENSKKSALKTETQKLLKTVYEEKQALIVTGSLLSKDLTTTGTDGSYKYKITVNTEGKITDYCVQYITSGTSYKYFMSGTGKTLDGKLQNDTETDAQVKEYAAAAADGTGGSSCSAS